MFELQHIYWIIRLLPAQNEGSALKKTQKQQKARWMWLEQVFMQIDELRIRCVKNEKEISNFRDTIKYLSEDFDSRLKIIEEFLGGQESMRKVLENRNVYKVESSENNEGVKGAKNAPIRT